MTAAPHPFAIHRDGRDLAGLEWGSGDDHVVLLHPNGFCAGFFDPLAPQRLATDHHVVEVDLAGHGSSSALPRDDLTFARLAGDVIAVLDGLGVTSALAVGQSLGGGVAILVDRTLAMFERQAAHGGGLPIAVVPGGHFLLQENTREAVNLLRSNLKNR